MSAISEFIARLVVHFGEPKFDVSDSDRPWAHKEWSRDMNDHLKKYDREVLELAASRMAAAGKYRRFPLLSECVAACDKAESWLDSQKPKLPIRDPGSLPEYSQDRENLARDLIKSPMGKQAAQEGWIWGLYVFCVRNARLPTHSEINEGKKALKPGAKAAELDVERAARGEFGALSPYILQMGKALLQRRDEMKDFVLHGVIR